MRFLKKSPYYFGICLPSQCSPEDTRKLFKTVLKPFPLAVEGEITCDTSESTSSLTRIKEMKTISIFAAIYLTIIISIVIYGTYLHVIEKEETKFAKSVSLLENIHSLFWVKANAKPDDLTPYLKVFVVFCGVAAHIMCCLESPIGFFMLSHHVNLKNVLADPSMISFFGDAGIVCITAAAGYSTFMFTYPIAEKGKLSIPLYVINKGIRFIPTILVIMSIDVLWYFPFNGPFVTRVGRTIVDKCTDTWWKSILFVNNLWGGTLQICSGHTYSISVDMQLTIVGLIGVILLARKPLIGFIYCICWIIWGNLLMFHYSVKNNVPSNLLAVNSAGLQEIENFLNNIHMATSSYITSYFASMLTAYTIYHGWWKKYSDKHKLWLTLFMSSATLAQHLPLLTNCFDIVPPKYVPLFILVNRLVVAFEMVVMIIYSSFFDFKPGYIPNIKPDLCKTNELPRNSNLTPADATADDDAPAIGSEKKDQNKLSSESKFNSNSIQSQTNSVTSESTTIEQEGYYSSMKAFLRLSFAIYMVNYTYIRTDFFVSRVPFYPSVYVLVSFNCFFFYSFIQLTQ